MKETNKWEDIKSDFPYKDILYLEHPTSKKHPRQPMTSRAAQFSPFAALTGYEDAVKEVARYTSKKKELEEEEKEKLDEEIKKIKKDEQIKVTYFVKDKKKEGGEYQKIIGLYQKIDTYHSLLELDHKRKIPLSDIVKITRIPTQED